MQLAPGVVVWAELAPHRGREQGGRRPVLVVSSAGYLEAVTTLAIAVPITEVNRGWPSRVLLVTDPAEPSSPSPIALTTLASWTITQSAASQPRATQTQGETDGQAHAR